MSLQTRLEALVAAIGADIKALQASSGGSLKYPYVHVPAPLSNQWYLIQPGSVGTVVSSAGRVYALPLVLPKQKTLTKVAVQVTTAVSGSSVRLGLYAAAANNKPGALLYDDGAAGLSGATVAYPNRTLTTPQVLAPDTLYFLALAVQGGAPTFRGRAANDPYIVDEAVTASATDTTLGVIGNCYVTSATTYTGALPNPYPANGSGQSPAPLIYLT